MPPVCLTGGGFSQGTDLPTVEEPGRGKILIRPTVQDRRIHDHPPLLPVPLVRGAPWLVKPRSERVRVGALRRVSSCVRERMIS